MRRISTLLVIAAAVCLISDATAVVDETSFGYHDPRSFQLRAPSDIAAIGGNGALMSTFSGRGPIRRFEPGRRPRVIAGGGTKEPGTEPLPATDVDLFGAGDLAVLPGGGFLISQPADSSVGLYENGEIRRIVSRRQMSGVSPGPSGSFLASETYGHRIDLISPDGEIDAVAGTGDRGLGPDGSMAADSPLLEVLDVGYLPSGEIVFSEFAADYQAIRVIRPDGTLDTLAGGLRTGFGGDGGPAVDATLRFVPEIAVQPDGDILIADGRRVRGIGTDGIIDTVAGTGKVRYNGDGIPATEANLSPASLSTVGDGSFLIGDFENGRIRQVSTAGVITTFAGLPAPSVCPAAVYNGIQGGPGDDPGLSGSVKRDLIRGETGNDVIRGRTNDDCISAGLDDDRVHGGSDRDDIDGENGDDRLTGNAGADVIDGQGGDDSLFGEQGDDSLYGGFADDELIGGKGDDRLRGDTGKDHFEGEGGDDYIDAQHNERESAPPVADRIECGPGRDTVKANTYDRIARDCEIVKGAAANR